MERIDSQHRFDSKTALVTGGGRGIGKAVALALAAEGASVSVFSRTEKEVSAVANTIRERGGNGRAITGNVCSESDIGEAVAATVSTFGSLDILVNCAGVFRMSPTAESSLEDWREIIDINLTGTYLASRAAGRHMLTACQGKIVNFGSLLSFVAFPERAAYAASKGGVLQLTRTLGVEWIKHGINVNAIVPGMIEIETPHPLAEKNRSIKDAFRDRTPQGRLGNTADIVGPTLFLASSAADFIAGQSLVVDGGWLAYGYL